MHTENPINVVGAGLPGGESRLMDFAPVRGAEVLAAGRSLLAALKHPTAENIPIGADIDGLLRTLADKRAQGRRITVLCSGDPLFFGLGSRLLAHFGAEALRFLPAPGTLSAAAGLCGIAVQDIRPVSLHGGRMWLPLLHALMEGGPVLALTDAASGPSGVANFLLERGLRGFTLHVLESISLDAEGFPKAGRHLRLSLEEAATLADDAPTAQRVLLFAPDGPRPPRSLFRPDAAYAVEQGLITKAPVRAFALSLLGVEEADTVWDLGAGCGSVGLEAAGFARRGLVVAVEAKPERVALIRENRARFQVLNLEVVTARLPDALPVAPEAAGPADLPLAFGSAGPLLPRPKRIFIGGGLGASEGAEAARDILARAWECLLPGGRLVVSCVLLGTLERVRRFFDDRGIAYGTELVQAQHGAPLAGDTRLVHDNPVFLLHAGKAR